MSSKKTSQATTIKIKDKDFKCPVCSNEYFTQRKVLLNTVAASFFGFDWANRSATCLVCANCTHVSMNVYDWKLGDISNTTMAEKITDLPFILGIEQFKPLI